MKVTLEHLKRNAVNNILSVNGKEKTTETINAEIDKIVDFVLMFSMVQQDELNKKLLNIIDGDIKWSKEKLSLW